MKNKKSIAIAMSVFAVGQAVAPAFADEIVGKVNDLIDLGHINGEKSQWIKDENGNIIREEIVKDDSVTEKQRIQAEKDLEKTVERINELASEKDSNGNLKYELKTEYIEAKIGANEKKSEFGYLQVTLADKTDMDKDLNPKVKYTFKFKTYKADFGFGQELPWNTENKISFDFENNVVKGYDEKTNTVEGKTLASGKKNVYAELSRVIYQLEKASSNITVIEENDGYTVYAGKIGQDPTGETKVARIDIKGKDKIDEKLITFVDANNDFLGHWAENTIVDSMIADIVDNSAKFRPEDSITRAEFAKVACKAFGLPEVKAKDYNGQFNDVNKSDWYVGYVAAMAEAGYMKGDGNKTFRPEDKITRQEAAVVIAKMHANKKDIDANERIEIEKVTTDVNGNRVHQDTVTDFVDDKEIAVWADESVNYLVNNKLSNGYELADGTERKEYKPANQIKRAEALVMMARAKGIAK